MRARTRIAVTLIVAIATLVAAPRPARAALEVYHVYVIWLQGEGEGDRQNLDAFITCLLDRSNYQDYWHGEANVVEAGSYVVPPPSGALGDAANIAPFIESLIKAGKIPAPPSYGVPIYQVMVDPAKTSCVLGGGTGGRNAPGTVNGRKAGLIITTTNPSTFWPARTPLGGETTLTQHEVAEVIDGLRGGDRCSGDCCCEGWCNNAASCGNFSGLECPGAPASTFTGSSACGSVKGWLIQTLSHQGASTCTCPITCDFKTASACSGSGEVLHAACKSDKDCCSGLSCQNWSFSGQPPFSASCCKAVGASCAQGTDCCGGLDCTGGKCTCVAEGKWCINDGDCCAGLVCDGSANKCAKPPPPPVPDAGGAGPSDAAPPTTSGGEDGGDSPPALDASTGDDSAAPPGNGGGGGCRAAGGSSPAVFGGAGALVWLVLARVRRRRARSFIAP